jgi:CubicO group peptidase (beta-lactamase class C family)
MSFIHKTFILLFVSLGVPLYCYAQGVGFDEAALTTFIESQMRASHVPGLAVGIVQRDRIVYLRGFGTTRDRESPRSLLSSSAL